jgi:hypothetical protein
MYNNILVLKKKTYPSFPVQLVLGLRTQFLAFGISFEICGKICGFAIRNMNGISVFYINGTMGYSLNINGYIMGYSWNMPGILM